MVKDPLSLLVLLAFMLDIFFEPAVKGVALGKAAGDQGVEKILLLPDARGEGACLAPKQGWKLKPMLIPHSVDSVLAEHVDVSPEKRE